MFIGGDGKNKTRLLTACSLAQQVGDDDSIRVDEPRAADDSIERGLRRETHGEIPASRADHRVAARREKPFDEAEVRRAGINDENIQWSGRLTGRLGRRS